ncbi:MAG: FliM/FliN family flagellar motor switch protein, partial [Pseudomonadota bacterium]
MGDTKADTVLRRIAAAGREEHKARAMSLQKAMRLSVAKVADALMDLPLNAIGLVVQPLDADAMTEALNEKHLLILMDGPALTRGAVVVDPVLVGGLIQQQTIGKVLPDIGVERTMTRTDAAICAPLIDTLLERTAGLVDDPADALVITGFRFGAKAEDARSLAITMEGSEFVGIRLTLDMAAGARQGEMMMIFPKPLPENMSDHDADDGGVDASSKGASVGLVDAVMALPAEVNMILCTVQLPLQALHTMQVGDVIDVPHGHFPDVQLTTTAGRIIGRGSVGHVDGVRAVKPRPKPLHATQPMRRASDAAATGQPTVEDLTSPESRGMEQTDASASPDTLDLPDLPDLPDMPGVQDDGGLPALPDMPAPGPETADAPAPSRADVDSDLPDLNDLPDLADLPDLKVGQIGQIRQIVQVRQ